MVSATRAEKEIVRRGFDALNDRDRDAFVELHADDAVLRAFGEEFRGIDEIAADQFGHFEAFPDLALVPEIVVAEGGTVAARWRMTGTHEGEFDGVEPTGREIEIPVAGLFGVENDRLADVRLVADRLGLLGQLGVVEPPSRGQPEAPKQGRETPKTAFATAPEEVKRIARRFPEGIATEGNVGLVERICAENVIDHNPLGDARGQEELTEHVEYLHRAFGDASATVEEILAEGDTAAMRVTLRGIHEGEFLGVEPTGSEFAVTNVVFTRVEDGRIAERWVLPDVLGLLQQLGAVELPGE